jgi:peptidoglycan/xylan/chitin deacetylase (PgdA/CDA1 family)
MRPGPIILGFHRIAAFAWDPQHLCVDPKNFSEQLEVLANAARPTSLATLTADLINGTMDRRSVAVTIDDGYADTFTEALPLLDRHDTPATVFVTTGFIGRSYWWTDIQTLVEQARELPATVCLHVHGHGFRCAGISGSVSSRRRLLRRLCDFWRTLPFKLQDEACEQLTDVLGPPGPEAVSTLTAEQVAELGRSGLVDIGSHGVTHTSVSRLSEPEQNRELRESKRVLESMSGRPVHAFSYPNGRVGDIAPGLASAAGYRCACTSREDVVSAGSSPYLLPRFWVPDWDGERFSRWLNRWLK